MSRYLVRAVAVFGVVMILAGVLIAWRGSERLQYDNSLRTWPDVEGKIVRITDKAHDLDNYQQATVRYTVDGTTRTVTGNWSTSDRESEYVRYNPDDPADAYFRSDAEYRSIRRGANDMMIVAGGGVIVMFGIGALILARTLPWTRAWLRRNGRQVTATVTCLEATGQWQGQPSRPWVIDGVWEDPEQPGRTHPIRSKPCWFDLRYIIRPGDPIDVRVHPRRPERYMIRLPNGHEITAGNLRE